MNSTFLSLRISSSGKSLQKASTLIAISIADFEDGFRLWTLIRVIGCLIIKKDAFIGMILSKTPLRIRVSEEGKDGERIK